MRTWLRGAAIAGLAPLVVLAALAGSAWADFTQVETVRATSATSSAAKSVTATCPAGKQVVGAGANVDNGLNPFVPYVFVDAIRPGPLLDRVTVRAREGETGSDYTWWVVAYAVCAPPPAGLERVVATSASSSLGKGIAAVCPSGKRLLGTGGEVTGPAGQVVVDGLLPDGALTRATVNALEDETGTADPWTVTAYAICSSPVRGLERVAATSAPDSAAAKHVDAPCPAGKTLTGGGGTMNSADARVRLDSVITMSSSTQFAQTGALEGPGGNSGDWSVSAFAICAASASVVSVASPRAADPFKIVPARCPDGTRLTGLGGQITGAAGAAWLRWLRPNAGLTAAEVLGATHGSPPPWALTAHAICRTAATGSSLATATGPPDPAPAKSVTATCPAGTRVLGAGGQGSDSTSVQEAQFVLLQAVRPDAALTSVTVDAKLRQGAPPIAWSPRAWAICGPAPAGLQRVVDTSTPDTDDVAGAAATCPAGKHLLGTGAQISGGDQLTGLDDLRPDAALIRTTVLATRPTGSPPAPSWSVSAYAICVNR